AEQRVEMVQKHFALLSEGKVDEAFASAPANVVQVHIGSPMMPQVEGRDAIIALTKQSLTVFPDFKIKATRIFDAGDVIVAEVVTQGTHKGAMGGQAATGKTFSTKAVITYHFDGAGMLTKAE